MTTTLTNAMNEMPRRTVDRTCSTSTATSTRDCATRCSTSRSGPAAWTRPTTSSSSSSSRTSHRVIGLLRDHHKYEEQPAFEAIVDRHVPTLAGLVHDEHHALAERLEWLASRADELAAAPAAARPAIAHVYYLELAAFTSAYLAHLDVEERVVMPAVAAACDDAELDARPSSGARDCSTRRRVPVAMAVMLPALDADRACHARGRDPRDRTAGSVRRRAGDRRAGAHANSCSARDQ